MGVDLYVKLQPRITDEEICRILTLITGIEVTLIHLAVFRAAEAVRPTWNDDIEFAQSHPDAGQDEEPGYLYWRLLHDTPALAVLADMYCRRYLFMGRAYHYRIPNSNGKTYDKEAISWYLKEGGLSIPALAAIMPQIAYIYWG